MKIKVNNVNEMNWKSVNVRSNLPDNIKKLEEIAHNLWWVWSKDAKKMFRTIDPEAWKKAVSNPVQLLNILSYEKLNELSNDESFVEKLDKLYNDFQDYVKTPYNTNVPSVAYFSMEYGLTEILKIYSGGLGVLAGDYLKEASDCAVNMTAIGFLYRYGYFTQTLSMEGQQVAVYDAQNFGALPITQLKDEFDEPLMVEVPYPDRIIYANLWKVQVGRISLILLDTDNDLNSEFDRPITHQLYGGDWENRLKQEILLGIGGILALKKLGIQKEVYHCNEGHAALINVQRLLDYIAQGLTHNEALEIVRSSSLYTVHTPVPAGHDSFSEDLFGKYMYSYPEKLNISWDELMDMGREHPGNKEEKFSMSVFACNTCQEVNGVSWLHGKVSQEMFNPIWKGYFPQELHVNYVTNGVHLPTWAASEWKTVYEKYLPKSFYKDQSNLKVWNAIYKIPDEVIWETRSGLKNRLINFIKIQFYENWMKNQGDPSRIVSVLEQINPNALIIGFGRRFATYKRAHLLFTDLERLSKIVNNPDKPVQFLFTGKAHPADGGGQGLIKRIIEISRMPQFLGKVIFLENYDMRLAKRLISGVDIWLNTPTRPLEASGTSGEKAQMNGVLNFSVLDGWWLEGYVKGAGWALTEKRTYENQEHQDQLDAATIYSMLENEIVPLYYNKNEQGISPEWIQHIKKSFAEITPRFTTKRMLDDYISKFYLKLQSRNNSLKANDFAKAKKLAAWKEKVAAGWDAIEILDVNLPELLIKDPHVGKDYSLEVTLDTNELNDNNIGVELVITQKSDKNKVELFDVVPLAQLDRKESVLKFGTTFKITQAGLFDYSFRMFPLHPDMPHRQDFCFVRWF